MNANKGDLPLTIFWHLDQYRPIVSYNSHFIPFPNSSTVQSTFSSVLPTLHFNRISNFPWIFSKLCFISISGNKNHFKSSCIEGLREQNDQSQGGTEPWSLTGGDEAGRWHPLHIDWDSHGQKDEPKQKQVLARMWRSWNPHALLAEMQNDVATVENGLVVPQKVKERITTWLSDLLLGVHSKDWKETLKQMLVHKHSEQHYSQQSQDGKNSHVHQQMNKQNVVYAYEGRLLSQKKKWGSATGHRADEPWEHYAEWDAPGTKWQISLLTWNTYFRQIHRDKKRKGELLLNRYRVSAWGGKNVLQTGNDDGHTTP